MMRKLVDVHCTIGTDQDVPLGTEQLIDIMDRYGIVKAVLSPSHKHIVVENEIGNDAMLELVKRYPERFLGYAVANPWYGEKASIELERALSSGLSGVKFHPALQGFFVFDERKIGSLMEVVRRFRVPVYIHTGTPVFALPFQVAELALRYPDITFIMGRMGNTDFWIDTPRAYEIAGNVYVDTPYTAPANIRRLLDIDSDRVLFSADLPYSHAGMERQKVEDIELEEQDWLKLARSNFERIFSQGVMTGGGELS